LIEATRRRFVLLRTPAAWTRVIPSSRVTLLAAVAVVVLNHVVLAAGGHLFAASCIDAVVVVFLLNAAAVHENRTGSSDLPISRAFGALALVAAVPVAAAALPLRHLSEAAGTITMALPVAAGSLYLAERQEIELPSLFLRGSARVQRAAIAGATVLGFCAYLLGAPTTSLHGAGSALLGVTALILAAIVEELLFRGVVQASLAQVFGPAGVVLATLVSVALFATVSWWLIPLLGAALVFALVVASTGALQPAVLAHITFTLGAAVVWPSLLRHWHPSLFIAVPVAVLLCGGTLVQVGRIMLTEERQRV
jgi:membrane protease YdiL (CAAX protease family)